LDAYLHACATAAAGEGYLIKIMNSMEKQARYLLVRFLTGSTPI